MVRKNLKRSVIHFILFFVKNQFFFFFESNYIDSKWKSKRKNLFWGEVRGRGEGEREETKKKK